LHQVITRIGPGFHFDTPPAEYIDREGRPLLFASDAGRLSRGLDRAVVILGRAEFEETCLHEVWRALGVRYDPAQDALVPIGA
jgi:hypothetical protein